MSRILIACGGTGGHLAPGIAIAETLQQRGHTCTLLISEKQVDSALIQKYDHLSFRKTPGRAFSGGVAQLVGSVRSILSSVLFSRQLLKEQNPDIVLLFGGFVSVGLGCAARLAGVPVALHEANCMPGKAIRLLKRIATRLYLPDDVRLQVPLERVRYYGYPVRQEIKHRSKVEACQRLGIEVPGKLLVVIGGSQGAEALNHWVSDHFEELAEQGVSVYCVTGLGKGEQAPIQRVNQQGQTITASFVPFSDAMGDVISAADLVITRAGAGSIAEIVRCRAPSILIPYPFAADDHQLANARAHEAQGAGMIVEQENLNSLIDTVRQLMFDDSALSKFEEQLERMDDFDSSEKIADDLLSLCESSGGGQSA